MLTDAGTVDERGTTMTEQPGGHLPEESDEQGGRIPGDDTEGHLARRGDAEQAEGDDVEGHGSKHR
jgi:hypothetical protein